MKTTGISKFSLIASSIILLFITIVSCEKEKDPTRSELIVGTWHLSAWGQDANLNGTLEGSEFLIVPSGSDIVETFNADHTGTAVITSNGTPTTTNFTWEFKNNDEQLLVTTTGTSPSTATVQVTTLTKTDLVGYDIAGSPRTIIVLKK